VSLVLTSITLFSYSTLFLLKFDLTLVVILVNRLQLVSIYIYLSSSIMLASH
jgi:hypothetical protein